MLHDVPLVIGLKNTVGREVGRSLESGGGLAENKGVPSIKNGSVTDKMSQRISCTRTHTHNCTVIASTGTSLCVERCFLIAQLLQNVREKGQI